MKIWNGYGSEHSANLVMIGHFKCEKDAQKVDELIRKLTSSLTGKVDIGSHLNKYPDEVGEILRKLDCYTLSPIELEHFFYEYDANVEGDKLIIRTDEMEVSAFFKLMIEGGAKVEIYTAHTYTNEAHSNT